MSRTGASTPEVTNTLAAASSRVCSLRRASARFRGDVRAVGPSTSGTLSVPLSASLQNRNYVPYAATEQGSACHCARAQNEPHVVADEAGRTNEAMSDTNGPQFGIMTAPSQVSYGEVLRVWQEADRIPQIEHAWLY